MGKKLSRIEEELAESYFPVEVYEGSLIEVLGGRRWFNIECSPAKVYQVGDRYVATVSAVIWKKAAMGGSNVIIVSSTGEAKSLKSDIKWAMSEALKNAYQHLWIGIGQLRQMKKAASNAQGRESDTGRDRHASEPVRTPAPPPKASATVVGGGNVQPNSRERKIIVTFLGRFNSMSSGYSADVVCAETGDARKLVVFKDSVPSIEKYCSLAKFIEHYRKGQSLTFIGYDNIFCATKQFVFKHPVVNKS